MRSSAIGDSVEGDSLELQCRKISLHGPTKNKLSPKLVFSFKLSIHGYARIAKPLADLTAVLSQTSHVSEGDEIHGERIFGFSFKPLGRQEVKHATGTHKATFVATKANSYALIEIGVREHLQAIDQRPN